MRFVLSHFIFFLCLFLLASAASGPGFSGIENRVIDSEKRVVFNDVLEDKNYSVGGYRVHCKESGYEILSYTDESEPDLRKEAFQMISLFSIEGEMSTSNHTMLESFFLTNAGAYFAKRILKEFVDAVRKGYFASRSCDSNKVYPLHDFFDGSLSDEGAFTQDFQVFEIREHFGKGAFAQPGLISLGTKGFSTHFPIGGQKVDPMAIIAHEFGHTRYADSQSGGTLPGERSTVVNYENPVRKVNGFEPRRTYFSSQEKSGIDIETGEILDWPDHHSNQRE